jgi:N-acetylglucosaminylphosphatidylinositol deacetylase
MVRVSRAHFFFSAHFSHTLFIPTLMDAPPAAAAAPAAAALACAAALLLLALVLVGARRAFSSWPRNVSASSSSSQSASSAAAAKPAALLVIAHPDDEAMFFVPTITCLQKDFDVRVLCLSSGACAEENKCSSARPPSLTFFSPPNTHPAAGNADNLGAVRARELVASGRVLGLAADRVAVVDRPELQDGMRNSWPAEAVAAAVQGHLQQQQQQQQSGRGGGGCAADVVVTFDEGGVSGHPNHVSVYRGVQAWAAGAGGGGGAGGEGGGEGKKGQAAASASSRCPCYALETVPVYRKFLGVLDVPVSVAIHALRGGGGGGGSGGGEKAAASPPPRVVLFGGWRSLLLSHAAMQAHRSQYVWFRRLFVVFSRYTTLNTLRRIA